MISIIIPTYNRKDLLPRAISSVLKQTYQDFEIIVVDDGSIDGTADFIKTNYSDPRIRYFEFDKNRGVNEARNKGLEEARGEIIALLDSDDEWFDNALEQVIDVFSSHLEVGFIIAPYYWGEGEELTGWDIKESRIVPFEEILCGTSAKGRKGGFIAFKRSLVGDLRWNVPYLQFVFFRRLQSKTETYFLSKPLGRYHFLNDATSVSVIRKIPNIEMSIRKAEEMDAFLNEFGAVLIKHSPQRYGIFAGGAMIGFLFGGNKPKALYYSKSAYINNRNSRSLVLYVLCLMMPISSYFLRIIFSVRKFLMKK